MNKLQPKSLLFASLILMLPGSALAEDDEQVKNWYTIEVISFTRHKEAGLQEQWLETAPAPVMEEAPVLEPITPETPATQELGQAFLDPMVIEPVPEGEWQLSRHAYSLGRSAELKIQSHQAWRQPGFSKEESPWIDLASESDQLSGKIRISLSRYLHADVDINLANPDWSPSYYPTSEAPPLQQAERIHFETSRRLKRDELHYIDHPLAGVLIRIERYEMPEPLVEEPPADALPGPDADKTEPTTPVSDNSKSDT